MPWAAPVVPIAGTVITVAYATGNIVNPINWLRQMTGGADPGLANRALISSGPTTTTWGLLPDIAMATQKVTRTGDTMTGDLQVNRSAQTSQPLQGYLILGANAAYYFGYDGGKHVLNTPRLNVTNDVYVDRASGGNATIGYVILGNNAAHFVGFDGTNTVADGSPIWTDANSPLRVTTPRIADGAVTTAKLADGQVTPAKLHSTVAIVPSGLIAAFPNAAAIASGWSRFTNGNGRFLVGAGTVAGQTFVEGASAGSTWAHLHGVSLSAAAVSGGNVQSGGSSTANTADHTHPVAGNTADATWIPPSFTVVWAQKS